MESHCAFLARNHKIMNIKHTFVINNMDGCAVGLTKPFMLFGVQVVVQLISSKAASLKID
jgi:hypothetical protein